MGVNLTHIYIFARLRKPDKGKICVGLILRSRSNFLHNVEVGPREGTRPTGEADASRLPQAHCQGDKKDNPQMRANLESKFCGP